MNPHEWFVEHRTAFATRTLEPDEERSFADHSSRCEECRTAVVEITSELAWLGMGAAPVTPRPGFRWRATSRALGTGRRWRSGLSVALAAAVVLLVGSVALLARTARRTDRLEGQLARSRSELGALADTVAVLRRAARLLQASIDLDDHKGALLIFADQTTHRWNVVLHGMPPAPPGQKYQFWFICADGMVQGAELKPTGDGTLMVTLGMPPSGGAVLGAALSVEPSANEGNVPQGRQLAHIML